MTERPIVHAADGGARAGRDLWVDAYLPDPYQEPKPAKSLIDTAWLRGALFRQRWLILATLVLAVLGGVVVTLLATPIYEAQSTVRISPFGNDIIAGQDATSMISTTAELDSFLQTQTAVVQSRKIAEVVAQSLNASARPSLLGPNIDESRPPGRSDEEWEQDKMKMAAKILLGSVTAEIPPDQLLVQITFQSTDPVLAAEAVNAYADAYILSDTTRSVESNAYARDYLLEQIDIVRNQLSDAERAANAYARNAGIVTSDTVGVDGESGQTITGANLSSINQTVAGARAARIAAEQKWRAVERLPASQLPEVQASPVIQSLTAEKAKLNGELTNLRERYIDDFPQIVDVKSRLRLIEAQIDTTSANIKAGIRNQYLVAERQEAALSRELGTVTNDALVEQDRKVEFTNLERNAQALRDQLKDLLMRYNQISTAANVKSGALTLLDSATVPTRPISPSLTRNLMLAIALGLAMAGGLALVREIFVDQFRRAEDVEERLDTPVLGLTPFVKSEDLDNQEANQFSSLLEAYASIRSTIDFTLPRDGAVLQMTSSQPSEGKSTTSLILAQLFARLGRRTLLIDGDLRKPSIVKLLGAEPNKVGITEVLLGSATLEEAMIGGGHDNLGILSVAEIPSNPIELLSSHQFRDFIETQRKNYSVILIDSPPVLGLADAPEISKVVDATIFVIEANRTSFAQARTSLQRMQKVGARVLGVILTKYRALEAGADYNYQDQYYQYGSKK